MKKKFFWFLFFANFFIIFFFWWKDSSVSILAGGSDLLIALGRICGLIAANLVLMQFLLIGRARWLEEVFGLDKLARIHHLNGELAITFIILHPVFLILGYSSHTKLGIVGQTLDFILNYEDVWMAAIAFIMFVVIVFLSIYIVRKHLKYETWYYIHIFNYLAVFLAFFHQFANGEDLLGIRLFYFYFLGLYVFVLGNHLVFRIIRPLYLFFKHRFYIDKVVTETNEVHSIYIKGKNLGEFKIKAGQFMKFRFLQKGFWWQEHPFSLSSMPNGEYIRITPKAVGDYTSIIGELKKGTQVYIDGPYGIFTEEVASKKNLLFIAGGIGITPIRSLIEQTAKDGFNVVLLYSNKVPSEVVFKKELNSLAKKYKFPVYYVYSEKEGRIDRDKITKYVKDYKSREVYICGPVPFMDGITQILVGMGIPKRFIHFEKFSL